MSKRDPVVAIICSDLHLQLRPPLAREEEPDWLAAMDRPLAEIRELVRKHKAIVLYAGDIFDRWNSPAELINWALEHLPSGWSIPGNHDLPNHRLELVHKSAYGTMVRAGKLNDLSNKGLQIRNTLYIYGFPFGSVPKFERPKHKGLVIGLVHEYLWQAGASYPGAPKEQKLSKVAKRFKPFDVVVVGDNHIGFKRKLKGGTVVLNCGTVMRRKSNEAHYEPQCGLIHESGKVSVHKFDISKDIITETVTEKEEKELKDMEDLVDGLSGLEASDLSFRDSIARAMKHKAVRPLVKQIILEALDE